MNCNRYIKKRIKSKYLTLVERAKIENQAIADIIGISKRTIREKK